jgi:glycine reductase
MSQVRVMHFLNQFFAGIGGEEKADTPVGSREGAVGPGKRLQDLMGGSAEIVVTAYCGDNYFSEHHDETLQKILQIAQDQNVKLVVAGPAFAAGRYGHACAEVCHFLSTSAGLDGVTAMSTQNPGVDGYRQYKDRKVFLFPTAEELVGMEDALSKMAQCVSKLATGVTIGPASEEGYVPRGIRVLEFVSKNGAERAVDMLVDKLAGRSFITEIPVESLEKIPVAPRITNLKDVCLALVATGGVTTEGNPAGFKSYHNTQWRKYSIDKLDSMLDAKWDVVHGGYNTVFMRNNPNYGVPLDVCRELEREGAFARLYPYFYGTTGVSTWLSAMQDAGKEMVLDMKAEGVDAVLLVST